MSKCEAEYVSEVGRRKDEVGELNNKFYEQYSPVAAGTRKPVAVYTDYVLRKKQANFLGEAFKLIWEEAVDIKAVVEGMIVRLNASGARIIELKHCSDETGASTTTCCKELHYEQKNLAAAFEKVKVLQWKLLR